MLFNFKKLINSSIPIFPKKNTDHFSNLLKATLSLTIVFLNVSFYFSREKKESQFSFDLIPNIANAQENDFTDTGSSKGDSRIGAGSYLGVFDGDGRTEPGHREGGASRGNCPPTDLPLTALIPKTNLGLTVNPYPTFWFYVPYESTTVTQAELMILDENRNPVTEKPLLVSLSQTPGIVSVPLPQTAKPLELNQKYHWYFSLVCDSENPSKNPTVDGWVKRVELRSELNNYQGYVSEGIWYDAMTQIGQSLQVNPSDPTAITEWQKLLEAVDLESLKQVPVID